MKFSKLFKTWDIDLKGSKFEFFNEIWVNDSYETGFYWKYIIDIISKNDLDELQWSLNNGDFTYDKFSLDKKPNWKPLISLLVELKEIHFDFKNENRTDSISINHESKEFSNHLLNKFKNDKALSNNIRVLCLNLILSFCEKNLKNMLECLQSENYLKLFRSLSFQTTSNGIILIFNVSKEEITNISKIFGDL